LLGGGEDPLPSTNVAVDRWSLCYGAKETALEFIVGSTRRSGNEDMPAMEQRVFLRAVTVILRSAERWGRDKENSWRLVFLFFPNSKDGEGIRGTLGDALISNIETSTLCISIMRCTQPNISEKI